jgi:hypothetical protein
MEAPICATPSDVMLLLCGDDPGSQCHFVMVVGVAKRKKCLAVNVLLRAGRRAKERCARLNFYSFMGLT